ncbi:kelch repeat-containing protein [Myxococcaceae bacterium GXIMD 01537]
MTTPDASLSADRVPYAGIWREEFSLVAVPGGALLAGGSAWHRDGIGAVPRPSTEVACFDAAAGTWTLLDPLPGARTGQAAVGLPGGRVLLVGGRTNEVMELGATLYWEPSTRRFREGPTLRTARARPTVVGLEGGGVLVLGSDFDEDMERGTRAEVLRPGADAWEPAGQTLRLFHPGPVCVSGGKVVIAGGRDNGFGFAIIEGQHLAPPLSRSTEIWDGERRAWRATGPLVESRDDAQGVTLSDGRILVVGGWHEGRLLASSEVWDPRTETWSATGSLALARSSFLLTALPDGGAAVSGGLAGDGYAASADVEVWNPRDGTWSPGTPLARPRAGHQVAALGGGEFLVVGGSRSTVDDNPETTWERWRPRR